MISRCPHPDLTACPLSFPCAYRHAPFLSSASNLYTIASFTAFPPVFCRYCFSGYRSSGRYRFYPQVQLSFCCAAIPGPFTGSCFSSWSSVLQAVFFCHSCSDRRPARLQNRSGTLSLLQIRQPAMTVCFSPYSHPVSATISAPDKTVFDRTMLQQRISPSTKYHLCTVYPSLPTIYTPPQALQSVGPPLLHLASALFRFRTALFPQDLYPDLKHIPLHFSQPPHASDLL